MAQLLKAMVRRESLSAASNISFIYLTNIYSALTLSRHTAGLWEFSDDQNVLFSVHGVYSLEAEIGIHEIIRGNCSERRKYSSCRRFCCKKETNLEGQGERS